MKRGTNVDKFLLPLARCSCQGYLTDELQVTDLLEWILREVGVSSVIQTTFSISEEYIRRLFFIREKGLVSNFDLLLDFKATNKTINLWCFIDNVADNAYLVDNHSKVLLVHSASGRKIVVVTSQNLTRGNRNEATMIAENADIYDSMFDRIQDIIKTQSLPLKDVLNGTASTD